MIIYKKFILIGIYILFFLSLFVFSKFKDQSASQQSGVQQPLWENYKVETMYLGGKSYRLILADTPDHRQQGLMFVRKPTKGFDGMVFRFPDTQSRTFWNKNTYVDLKLYWMIHGDVIGTSELPSIEKSNHIVTVDSPSAVDTVV